MSYRILVVNHDYGRFMDQMYHDDQRLARASFTEQHDARMKTFFGVNDFYSSNLRKLGHEAIDLICNNRFMQYAWAVENGLMAKSTDHCEGFIRSLPKEWLNAVFQAQVIKFKPDVIVNLGMASVTSDTLKKIKSGVPLIIGQHASPITPSMQDLSAYDLIVSSLPNLVEHFRNQGKQSTYFRLGFEAEILKNIAPVKEKNVDLAFVGGFSTHHLGGAKLFDYLADQGFSMALYGYGQESLSQKAASFFRGPLFGLGMYDLYASSKIVINRHIDVSGEYANNMRLYEGTGAGALMLTEAKKNLDTLFSPGTEVVAYNSIEECAELARYYLSHDEEREQIALNGQRRTLSEHTYYHRMSDLLGIIEEYSGMTGKSSGSITASISPNAIDPQNDLSVSVDRPDNNPVNEFEKLKNSQSYTLSGSFDAVLKTIRENIEHFPRRVPGKLNLDGKDLYYADLHSFYHQSMQIFAKKIYDFETEVDAPIILDCGAHIGLASIFFASRHPNAMIYAFEADPLIAQMCNENIRSFGLSDRVKVSNQAIWTHRDGIFFNSSCDDSGHIAGDQASEEIRTPSIRLRDIIKDLPIDFIKMDIEGGEFEVLKDCKDVLSNVNKIIAEVHQLGAMPGATSDLLKVLEENNFSYVFDDLNSAPWVEDFKKPPFSKIKTNKYYITVYAWQQSKVSSPHQGQKTDDIQPIAISPEGEIYLTSNAIVKRLNDKGKKVEEFRLEGRPTSLAVANNTRMYVGMKDHIQVYEGGRPVARWPSLGRKAAITNIVIDAPDIFAADAGNGMIIRYDEYGNVIDHKAEKHTGWNAPKSMTTGPYFSLAVDNQKNARMIKHEVPGHYKRIYQYHVHKSGGTSLSHMMFSSVVDSGQKCYCAIGRSDNGKGVSNGIAFASWKTPAVEQGNYYYAHSHTPMHQLNLPPDTFTVTILRDPVKRLVSQYRYLREVQIIAPDHPGMKTEGAWLGNSFSDFVRNMPKSHLFHQTYFFSKNYNTQEAFENIINCSYFFFTEEFAAGVAELSLLLGVELTPRHVRKSTIDVEIKESDIEYLRNLLQKEYDLIKKLREFKKRNTFTSPNDLAHTLVE